MVSNPVLRRRLFKACLMGLWLLVSALLPLAARQLDFMVLGWPFYYWMAAQGSVLSFLVLIAVSAWYDNRHAGPEDEAAPPSS